MQEFTEIEFSVNIFKNGQMEYGKKTEKRNIKKDLVDGINVLMIIVLNKWKIFTKKFMKVLEVIQIEFQNQKVKKYHMKLLKLYSQTKLSELVLMEINIEEIQE